MAMVQRATMAVAAFLAAFVVVGSPDARADTYKVDPVHSTILFRIRHFNVGYIWGRFDDFAGEFTFDERNPSADSLKIEVKVESLDTNNKNRDKHLRSPDFFNTAEYPTARFESTQVRKLDEHHYEMTGELTLHGTTKPVTVQMERIGEAKDPRGNVRAGLEATFTIQRSDFGMKNMLTMIGDEVRIIVAVEGIKH